MAFVAGVFAGRAFAPVGAADPASALSMETGSCERQSEKLLDDSADVLAKLAAKLMGTKDAKAFKEGECQCLTKTKAILKNACLNGSLSRQAAEFARAAKQAAYMETHSRNKVVTKK